MEQAKTKGIGERFLHFYRQVLMRILILLVALLLFCAQFYFTFRSELKSQCGTALQTRTDMIVGIDHEKRINDLYLSIMSKSNLVWLKISALELADEEVTTAALADLNADTRDTNTYYYYDPETGNCIAGKVGDRLDLTEDQMTQLLGTKSLMAGKKQYGCRKCGNGRLIAEFQTVIPSEISDLSTVYMHTSYLCVDSETGEIQQNSPTSKDQDFHGFDNLTNVDQLCQVEPIMNFPELEGQENILWLSTQPTGVEKLKNLCVAVKVDEVDPGMDVYGYRSVAEIAKDAAMLVLLPFSLMLLFALLSIYAARKYRAKWKETKVKGHEVQLTRSIRLDVTLMKNVTFVQCVIGVLVIFLSLFMLVLNECANQYQNGEKIMGQLDYYVEQNAIGIQWMQEQFEEEAENCVKICVDYLNEHQDDGTDIDKFLNSVRKNFGAEEISVYDEDGTIVYSTTSYEGYRLSTRTDEAEAHLWELIDGEKNTLTYAMDEESGLYCSALRRVDDIGVVAMKITDEKLIGFKEELSFNNGLRNVGFGTAEKLYINDDDPNLLYRVDSDTGEVETVKNTLMVLENKDEWSGFRMLQDQLFFVFGWGEETRTVFYAQPISTITGKVLPNGWLMLAAAVLLTLLVLLGTCLVSDEDAEGEQANAEKCQQIVAPVQREILLFDCGAVLLCVLLILLVNSWADDGMSILKFLISGNWKKGRNIFALASILISAAVTYFVYRIVKWFFQTLSKSLTPYSATVCSLLGSTVNLGLFAVLVFSSLNLLGVDTTTIVAGIGVTGIALGVGAKDTINSLLAGVLVILDGNVAVGDTVEVNGFRGKITQMGVRNTKLHNDDAEISVDNSAMSSVMNYSKGKLKAKVEFTVSYGTDIDALEYVIWKNTSRLAKACGGKLKGELKFDGIGGYENGLNCSISAPVNGHDKKDAEDELRREFIKVLLESGIQLC